MRMLLALAVMFGGAWLLAELSFALSSPIPAIVGSVVIVLIMMVILGGGGRKRRGRGRPR